MKRPRPTTHLSSSAVQPSSASSASSAGMRKKRRLTRTGLPASLDVDAHCGERAENSVVQPVKEESSSEETFPKEQRVRVDLKVAFITMESYKGAESTASLAEAVRLCVNSPANVLGIAFPHWSEEYLRVQFRLIVRAELMRLQRDMRTIHEVGPVMCVCFPEAPEMFLSGVPPYFRGLGLRS